jgi:hypothetical protein
MLSGYQMEQSLSRVLRLMPPGYQIEQSLSRALRLMPPGYRIAHTRCGALRLIPPGNQIAQLAIVRGDLMQPCIRQSVVDGPCAI